MCDRIFRRFGGRQARLQEQRRVEMLERQVEELNRALAAQDNERRQLEHSILSEIAAAVAAAEAKKDAEMQRRLAEAAQPKVGMETAGGRLLQYSGGAARKQLH